MHMHTIVHTNRSEAAANGILVLLGSGVISDSSLRIPHAGAARPAAVLVACSGRCSGRVAAVPGPRYHPRTILRQTLTVRLGLRLRLKSYGLVSVFRLRRRGWLGRGRRRRCRGRRRGRLWRRWLGRFGRRLGPLPLWISETVPYHPDHADPCYWDAVLRFRASAEWPASHASRPSDKVIGGYLASS